jgi:hypothetical protein
MLEERTYDIFENEEKKYKYTHDDFISVLFKELSWFVHKL